MLKEYVALEAGDVVLDIGSNDGTTLSFFPAHLQRIGMDPTAAKFARFYDPGIVAVSDFFSADLFEEKSAGRKAKVVTSIAMFYDLENPLAFVEQIERVLDDEGVWHLEQSYMPMMLQQTAYDTVCHEHLEYYSLRQIQWMLGRCGLKILTVELNSVNGGSFAVTAAKSHSHYTADTAGIERVLADEDKLSLHALEPYRDFATRVSAHRDDLLALLHRIHANGDRVIGYGASTKGNVILQFCGIDESIIPFIAEVNEEKFGRLTPGSEIPIISENDARAMKPAYLLVMPWHFRDNLVAREAEYLAAGGRMIFPLPHIEIVGGVVEG
jgi:hypothetical protein